MQSARWKKILKKDERRLTQYKTGSKVVAKLGARLAEGYEIGWRPPCLQFVPFPSLSQAEAEGEFIPSIAAWFIAVLVQRSHKKTGEIFPGAVAVPGLGRCPKALGFRVGAERRLQPWRSSHLEEHLLAAWVLHWKHTEPPGYKTFQQAPLAPACCQASSAAAHAASPLRHLGHSWGAPAVRQQQVRNVPASRFMAGIWIVSSSLLAHSTYRFPSCCTGRLWEGQAVMAVLFSPPFQVGAAVGNALQVSARAGMEAGETSGHTVRSTSCLPFGSAVQITL